MSTISSSSTMRRVTCLWVMLHVLPQGVITFFPSRLSGVDIGDGTLTHADITEVGILKAVASYFEANPRPNTTLAAGDLTQMKNITTRKLFQAYYGEGVSETRFQDTITSIINANNQVNLNLFNVSVWHCNGETIREANQKMMNLREQAIAVLSQSNTNFDQARNLNFCTSCKCFTATQTGLSSAELFHTTPSNTTASQTPASAVMAVRWTTPVHQWQPWGASTKTLPSGPSPPHSHLHQAAAHAATEHTTYFFDDEEYGIRGIIGTKKFNELFQLKPEASFALVIDYSGSMKEDIAAVLSVIRATLEKPVNYILSLFNDPLSKSRVYLPDDGNDALRYLGEINIADGGDCPEYAMDGLMNALTVRNHNIDVFVFTDASAKDAPLHVAVLSLAALKNVHLQFILTGDCRFSRTGEDLYRTLATATGGSVYFTNKNGIATVVDIIKESLTPSVTIAKSSISASDVNVTFPVDQTILQATIKIVTLDSNTPVYILYTPDNTEATSNVIVSDLGDGIQLVKIQNPTPGMWRLARQGSNSWEVEVKGQSTLDISITFVKLDPNTGFEYEMTAKPIAGENATVIVRIPSSENIGTVDNLMLTDPEGSELARHGGMTQVASRADSLVYRITFPLPAKAFQMATEGTDKAGNQFLRLRPKTIVPVTIDLKLLPLTGNWYSMTCTKKVSVSDHPIPSVAFYDKHGLHRIYTTPDLHEFIPLGRVVVLAATSIWQCGSLYINEQLAVPFLVINKGAAGSTVTVTVRDDQNFVKTTTSLEYMLQPGQNTLGQFSLHAGSTVGVTSTVTVSASASAAADDDFQYDTVIVTTEERVVRKEDNTIPVCNITAVTGSCDVTMLDPCMCSQYKWSGTAEIQDDGFGLYLVTASVNTTGTFRHDPFSVGYNGTISATITSDCCHPLAYITVVDLASNTGQCVFYLAPRLTNYVHSFKPTTQCQKASQPASQTSSDWWSTDRVIMAIAAQDAAILVIVILISICVVCVRGRNKKKTDVK